MKRRDFLQFMGVSAAATTASVALAKIPEAESQIILLDKPKEIIQAKTIPDVDFIISEGLINIEYSDERDIYVFDKAFSELNSDKRYNSVSIEIEAYAMNNTNLMQINAFDTFSFDFKEGHFGNIPLQKYDNLYHLNGRRFKVTGHTVSMNIDTITTVNIRAKEIL